MPAPTPAIPVFASDIMTTQTGLNAVGSNLTNLYNYAMGGFRTLKPICAVRVTGTHSIPSGADTQISWDVADLNYDGMWVSGAPAVLTVATAGVYRIHLQAAHAGANGFNEAAYICVNGTSTSTNAVGSVNVGNGVMVPCSALVGLTAGATIYGFIFQATGGSVNLRLTDGGCRLAAEWVST